MMHINASKSILKFSVVLCLVTLVLCNSKSLGQSRNQDVSDPLLPIPAHQRTRLIERLNLLIKYQRGQQWEKIYDLLMASIKGGRTREDYASRHREIETSLPFSTLLAFAPTEAITVDESPEGGAWFILGCAQYHRKGKKVQIKSGVTADLQNNEWFFSEIGAATQIDGAEEPCSTPKRLAPQSRRTAALCPVAQGKKNKRVSLAIPMRLNCPARLKFTLKDNETGLEYFNFRTLFIKPRTVQEVPVKPTETGSIEGSQSKK